MLQSSRSLLTCHFIGVILNSLFYSITLAQTCHYFRNYKNDHYFMKFLVTLLWSLDTAQYCLAVRSLYIYTIIGRADLAVLEVVSEPFEISMAITYIVAFIVQMIYAYRIWHLSLHNICLVCAVIFLALVALGSGTAIVIKTYRDPRWDHANLNNLPASLILVSTVLCDIVIAISQVWLFHRSRSMYGRLSDLITRLTVLVVNIGSLTSVFATIFLILFLVCPVNGAFIVPYLLLSNCYLNSFLSVLNSRRLLRELAEHDVHLDTLPASLPHNALPPRLCI